MNAHRFTRRAGAVLLGAVCLAAAHRTQPAAAQCSYPSLTNLSPVTVGTSPAFFSFHQTDPYWMVVGVMPGGTADWDIGVWQSTAGYPTCVADPLAASLYGGGAVDLVVGDFGHNAPGTYYVKTELWGGAGSASVMRHASGGYLIVNDAFTSTVFTAGGPFLRIWDVHLEAGQSYEFVVHPNSLTASLALFRNATGGACWKGRPEAEFETSSEHVYTAPATGFYGVVLVNEDGAAGEVLAGVNACTPPIPLASDVPVSSTLAINHYSFHQEAPYWTAIAYRNDDYSYLGLYRSNPGTLPICFTDGLAGGGPFSNSPALVVGDFNATPTGTYYAVASHSYNAPAHLGTIQWDSGADQLSVNGPIVDGALGPSDLVRIWDVWLEAGSTYHFTFSPAGADLRLLLFRNLGGGEYWAGRFSSEFETSTDYDYTAPADGWYGAAVLNDDGGNGTYTVGVGICESPVALTAGVTYATNALGYFSLTQQQNYWTAIGVRGPSDWDIEAFRYGTGGTFPACFSDLLALSQWNAPTVDFVVGDFNRNPLGPYHVHPYLYLRSGSGMGEVQWDAGADPIEVNGATITRNTDGSRVLEVWDVPLAAGVPYRVRFVPQGPASHRMFVFENAGGGEYWAPRAFAAVDATGPATYTPLNSGWHGVVVVNENGEPGMFNLRIDTEPVAVEPGPVVATAFRAVGPNPARGGVRIEFALREAGAVTFDVHDMTGRRVAAVPARTWDAGAWTSEWDGHAANGERLGAGIYFIVMRVGGRAVGTRRITLLE